MAVTEEDSVKKAIEAGKEEDIVRLREQGCPIRHEHLVLIRSIPKIRWVFYTIWFTLGFLFK